MVQNDLLYLSFRGTIQIVGNTENFPQSCQQKEPEDGAKKSTDAANDLPHRCFSNYLIISSSQLAELLQDHCYLSSRNLSLRVEGGRRSFATNNTLLHTPGHGLPGQSLTLAESV